jgi:hypothetical protein
MRVGGENEDADRGRGPRPHSKPIMAAAFGSVRLRWRLHAPATAIFSSSAKKYTHHLL